MRARHATNHWSRWRMIADTRLVHQITITPRQATLDIYEQHYDTIDKVGFDLFSFAVLLAKQGNWVNTPTRSHVWRRHPTSSSNTNIITPARTLKWQQWACEQFDLPIPLYCATFRWPDNILIQPGYQLQ